MDKPGSITIKQGKSADDALLINLPASKSISNRLLIMNALSDGKIKINNLSTARDTEVLAEILSSKVKDIDVGAAGTAMRFLTAYAAVTPGYFAIRGSERMNQRPIEPLVDTLKSIGADITYLGKKGFAPLEILGGELEGGLVLIDSTVSSQFVTALLMIAPYVKHGLLIKMIGGVTSRPYMLMTCELMRKCGAGVFFVNDNFIEVQPFHYSETEITVEPDWTSASYFYSWMALNDAEELRISGLASESLQGDRRLVEIYADFGVNSIFEEDGNLLLTKETISPKKLAYDLNDCPDLAQTIACTAAGLKIPLKLTGLKTLKNKETDRLAALKNELGKIGVEVRVGKEDIELISFDGEKAEVPEISTYEDHRMAMSFAPLATLFSAMKIEDPEVVQKSFPDFWSQFEKLGMQIK